MLPAAKPPPLGWIERSEIQPSGGRSECTPHARLAPRPENDSRRSSIAVLIGRTQADRLIQEGFAETVDTAAKLKLTCLLVKAAYLKVLAVGEVTCQGTGPTI